MEDSDLPDPANADAKSQNLPLDRYPLDGKDISQVSDETLTALFDTAPDLHPYGTRIVRVSQTLVLKGGTGARPCEANILNLIADSEHVGFETIRVPKGDLKPTERMNVVSQVASMISTLRSIRLSQEQQDLPGPIGCEACVACGYWFTDIGAGPFRSKEHMETWFNRRLDITQKFYQAPDNAPLFHFGKMVLTHLDIAPRNLILGADGQVWLIDWGNAGIYPDGFEIASLKARRSESPEFTDVSLGILSNMIPEHKELFQQLRTIAFALTTGQWLGRERLDFGQI